MRFYTTVYRHVRLEIDYITKIFLQNFQWDFKEFMICSLKDAVFLPSQISSNHLAKNFPVVKSESNFRQICLQSAWYAHADYIISRMVQTSGAIHLHNGKHENY